MRQLLKGALCGRFVRPPSYKTGAVAEAIAGDVVIAHFDHEGGTQRLPFGGPSRAPAAGPARSVACETGRRDELYEAFGNGRLFSVGEGGGKADVVEKSVIV